MNSSSRVTRLPVDVDCRPYGEVYPDISQHPIVVFLALAAYSTVFLLSLLGNSGEDVTLSPGYYSPSDPRPP